MKSFILENTHKKILSLETYFGRLGDEGFDSENFLLSKKSMNFISTKLRKETVFLLLLVLILLV